MNDFSWNLFKFFKQLKQFTVVDRPAVKYERVDPAKAFYKVSYVFEKWRIWESKDDVNLNSSYLLCCQFKLAAIA